MSLFWVLPDQRAAHVFPLLTVYCPNYIIHLSHMYIRYRYVYTVSRSQYIRARARKGAHGPTPLLSLLVL